MAFCVTCGSQLVNGARFCSSCGAPVHDEATLAAHAAVAPADAPASDNPSAAVTPTYAGLFGKRHRDRDFRAHVEQALNDDVLTASEEADLFAWAEAQGITERDWAKRFRDLLDRMLIASVNDGRLPDITSQATIVLKPGEMAHYVVAASLMKEVTLREFRGGSHGFSFPIAKGVRFRTGSFRGKRIGRASCRERV